MQTLVFAYENNNNNNNSDNNINLVSFIYMENERTKTTLQNMFCPVYQSAHCTTWLILVIVKHKLTF